MASARFLMSGAPILAALTLLPFGSPQGKPSGADADAVLGDIPAERVETGILYDRVLPISRIERFDGGPEAPTVTGSAWRQIYSEIHRASLAAPSWPALAAVIRRGHVKAASGHVPIAVLNYGYDRIRPDALERGALIARGDRLVLGEGDAFETRRAFAAVGFTEHTYNGAQVIFRLDREDYFTNDPGEMISVEVDYDDGRGHVLTAFDRDETVRYTEPGTKTIRVRLARPGGAPLSSSFQIEVRALTAPPPSQTLQITATIPYQGVFGNGEAYVYLSGEHTTLTEPVVVIEGFDPDNAMNWPELYDILNMEGLIETLRARGFDAVVLNFADGADYIQRNAFVTVELLQRVRSLIEPGRTIAVVGASMGGVVARYALTYMESQSIPHDVRTFISFDSPQTGADVPLGMQYWLWFFSEQSEEAAANLADLDTPAARQMLVYHHTDPPGATGQADPLRSVLLGDLTALGNYPTGSRLVAVANGSGSRSSQGFNPGDQIIQWEYRSWFVDFTGNVWAVPDGTSHIIFDGLIDFILLPADEAQVVVSGTLPYDGAPGGWRDSMAQLDASDPGWGDIIALHPNHCFIPSVSALGLETSDLFYDIVGDPNILDISPFDAVYFPTANQEHITITPENAPWFLAEIERGAASLTDPSGPASGIARIDAAPSPTSGETRIHYNVPRSGPVQVSVYDAAGRQVGVIENRDVRAGRREGDWDGRGLDGEPLSPGVYFLRLKGDGFAASRKIVLR